MFCGNGGSAADSQQLAVELTGRFIKDRKPLAAMALSSDRPAPTFIDTTTIRSPMSSSARCVDWAKPATA